MVDAIGRLLLTGSNAMAAVRYLPKRAPRALNLIFDRPNELAGDDRK